MLQWKQTKEGQTALLIKGPRRVGKSTIAQEFARNEYKSHIIVDFADAPETLWEAVRNISNRDDFFMRLQFIYGTKLYERQSVIIFDEIQKCPEARQAIKYLVKDHRYDYIETGSLLSIKKMYKVLSFQAKKHDLLCTLWITKSSVGLWAMKLLFLSFNRFSKLVVLWAMVCAESCCEIYVCICS